MTEQLINITLLLLAINKERTDWRSFATAIVCLLLILKEMLSQ